MTKFVVFVLFVASLVWLGQQQPPDCNKAPREYTIIVHRDTCALYLGSMYYGKVMITGTPLDSLIQSLQPKIVKK